jgi:hypothetical protein
MVCLNKLKRLSVLLVLALFLFTACESGKPFGVARSNTVNEL